MKEVLRGVNAPLFLMLNIFIPDIYIMDYKPYSPEWHRKRYLKEALDKYLDEYVPNKVICDDILSILSERSESAYAEWNKTEELSEMIHSK